MKSIYAARRRPCAGLTIVEGILAIAVIQVAVFAVSVAIGAGSVQIEAAEQAMEGVTLAETLVEEILVLPYADPDGPSAPGPEPGETDPTEFDNVDDYDGYTDRVVLSGRGGADAITRVVAVSYVDAHIDDLGRTIPGLTVTVRVGGAGWPWQISRFVAEPTP